MGLFRRARFALSLLWYRHILKNKFKSFGEKVVVDCPLKMSGFNYMSLGERVTLNYRSWVEASPILREDCNLTIGDYSVIGNYNHIYAVRSVIIGKNVLTADKVYISDNTHSFADIDIPIMKQSINFIGEVVIGDGTWIGENVCILGSNVGRNCVIGANSVVTKDIPDYCVAVGAPAKVIKQYDFKTKQWLSV